MNLLDINNDTITYYFAMKVDSWYIYIYKTDKQFKFKKKQQKQKTPYF